jgi:Flp pilus assembly protein TadD
LFRQPTRGEWGAVFQEIAAALEKRAAAPPRQVRALSPAPALDSGLTLTLTAPGGRWEAGRIAEMGVPLLAAGRDAGTGTSAGTAPVSERARAASALERPEQHIALGTAHAEAGDAAGALACFRNALRLQPDSAEAHFHVGNALLKLDRAAEAEAAFLESLRCGPTTANVCNNLGVALLRLDRPADAAERLRTAVRLRPEHAEAQHNLGTACLRSRQPREAAAAFRAALELRPDAGPALRNQFGVALTEAGELDEAEAVYRECGRRWPESGEILNNLGHLLCQRQAFAEAERVLRRAVEVAPRLPEAHTNLAMALAARLEWAAAVEHMQEAVRLRPEEPGRYNNLANVLVKHGQYDAADAAYAVAERLDPDYAIGRKNRGLAQLAVGDFARGWAGYEWRLRTGEAKPQEFRQPRWDGSSLAGRVLLLHAEQGLGDTLQFCRYAPWIKARFGGTIYLACQARLAPLLAGQPGLDRVLPGGAALPDFDVQAPLMSLPLLLGATTAADLPAEIPYLFADPGRIDRWRTQLAGIDCFRVGVHWQGSPTFIDDRYRSPPLRHFAPLVGVPGVRLISLQRGPGGEQLAAVGADWGVVELGPDADADGAFVDTAAVLTHLDLVVTGDTALVHLAGALGVPVWVALAREADWRWLRERDDSPWYPTVRLFRQRNWGDWDEVFGRMAAALRERRAAASQGRPRPLLVALSPGELAERIARLEGEPGGAEALAEARTLWQDVQPSATLSRLAEELHATHAELRQAEETMRRSEREGDFGPSFVAGARTAWRAREKLRALVLDLNACGAGEGRRDGRSRTTKPTP